MKTYPKSSTRGQTLVEWALVLPVLVLIVLVVLDVGRAVYYYSTIYNSAREGARYGIVHYNDSSLADSIKEQVESFAVGLDPDSLTINSTELNKDYGTYNPADTDQELSYIRVDVSYKFAVVTPLAAPFIKSDELTLVTESTMQVEK